MTAPKIVDAETYRAARVALLAHEKELTRHHDTVMAERRALPLTLVDKQYTFTAQDPEANDPATASTTRTLTLQDLFAGRPQLIIYHFMFDPSWDQGCASCTLLGQHIPAAIEHLHSRGVSLVVVSRAPIHKIVAYQKAMGWEGKFPWVSSYGGDFNYDFGVTQEDDAEKNRKVEYNFASKDELEAKGLGFFARGEQPGHSCFVRGGTELGGGSGPTEGEGDGEKGDAVKVPGGPDEVYRTYSTYARGGEGPISVFAWLDMTFLGRRDRMAREKGIEGLGFRRSGTYEAGETETKEGLTE